MPIVTAIRERGMLIITAGNNTLRFVPILTVTENEIEEEMKILEEARGVASSSGGGAMLGRGA